MPVMIDHSYVHNLKQLRKYNAYKKFKLERGKKVVKQYMLDRPWKMQYLWHVRRLRYHGKIFGSKSIG